jgi:hypothetical protein
MQWLKTDLSGYTFSLQGSSLGELRLQVNSNSCLVVGRLKGHEIHIRRVGFWKSRIEITDAFGSLLLGMQPKKWHTDTFEVQTKGQVLTCKLRHSPLTEYVILQEEEEVLGYRLVQANRQAGVEIRQHAQYPGESFIELHLLLWYLFLPLNQESDGEQQLQWMELAS